MTNRDGDERLRESARVYRHERGDRVLITGPARGNGTAPAARPRAIPRAWPEIDNAAYHGLAGDVVFAVEPHTEADPVALLLQYLTAFGNAIGRGPFYQRSQGYVLGPCPADYPGRRSGMDGKAHQIRAFQRRGGDLGRT